MQDNSITHVTQKEEVKKVSLDKTKALKIILSAFLLILLIILVIVYRNKKADDIESAQADIIAQAMELNDIENFSTYKGLTGGLNQGGSNQPKLTQKVKIQKQLEQIQPLNDEGIADSAGKIGVVFIGDPYTKGEIEVFNEYIQDDEKVNSSVIFIDGAEDKFNTSYWEKSLNAWENVAQKTIMNNLSTKQVQIIWINLSFAEYDSDLNKAIKDYTISLEKIITNALINFPNSRVVYLSSPRNALNSEITDYIEPNSYETGFAVREVITRQEEGQLNFKENIQTLDSEPVLLWGPYIWTKEFNGGTDFSYTTENFESDGLTLSTSGKQRYAIDLYNFWTSYEFGRSWFLAK